MRLLLAILLLLLLAGLLQAAEPRTGEEWKDAGKSAAAQAILAKWHPDGRHEFRMVAMRDGVRLAADIYLPPGDGPWPVMLVRSPYGRFQAVKYATGAPWAGAPIAWVSMDTRGDGDSEGVVAPFISENEIADSYDAAEWVAQQPWCNGRIGALGGSGNGLCAGALYLARHPKVVAVQPGNSNPDVLYGWAFENGVRKWLAGWCNNRMRDGRALPDWPRPTLVAYDPDAWKQRVTDAARGNTTLYIGDDGWYNIFHDANLQFYSAVTAGGGRISFSIGAGGHGGIDAPGARPWKALRYTPGIPAQPTLSDLLLGKAQAPTDPSLRFALLGDVTKGAQAVGNAVYAVRSWPLPAVPAEYYLTAAGTLTLQPGDAGTRTWTYDPRDPAPFAGGGFSYGTGATGPADQRPLLARQDVLRFATEPLAEPLIVIGQVRVELTLTADVPDTTLIAKVVDVYPDGTEALIREGVCMARYRDGFAKPAPLPVRAPVTVAWNLPHLACAFEPGHRFAIYLTNSAAIPVVDARGKKSWVEVYEVHPNTWDPVPSLEQAVTAHFTLTCGGATSSRIILPQVKPETLK